RRPPGGGPHPGEKFVHAEGLGDVVVRARVQRLHLVGAVSAAGQDDDGRAGPAAQPADYLHPVQVRQAEVEDHQVRRAVAGPLQRLPAGGGRVHLVAAHPQVDPQRAQDLRLVVDYQNAGHVASLPPSAAAAGGEGACPRSRRPGSAWPGWPSARAAGRDMTMVSPPPGVSSGSSVPPMASVSPRDSARPSPTPVVLSVSPSRWKGTNTRSRSGSGMPGPRSATPSSTRSPSALAVSSGGRPA